MLRYFSVFLCLLLRISAEEPYSFEKAPGRLPKDVVPLHYAIRLDADIEKAVFQGEVQIEVEARNAAKEIILNSLELKITEAKLDNQRITATADDAAQLLKLTGREIAKGKHLIDLRFTGKLTEKTEGLYLTKYQLPSGEQRMALVTQMEATDARRMFPCWDEPAFRATFQLTSIVPRGHTALFNMPEERETALPDGRREIAFGTTPSMPSYLVAYASAELEAIEDEVDGVQLRVLATPGKREQMRYALEATKKILPYFNEYFGVKYPLPKLDQVSFPSVAAGGMENWGCIIYSDTAFLFDPAKSSQSTRERVFDIVAHEIAHQWFGDLVTMGWWDNLWLNEGFASWMATKTSDKFNPSWKKWLRAAGSKEIAMRLDARATTHPIQQPVKDEAEAMQVFDEITYQKGQAFLRMLETWLGEEKFRDGLRAYFKKHAYGNTTTADLWNALQEVSGEQVRTMAAGWTEQPGFPLIAVGSGKLAQSRFAIHHQPSPLTWDIPVNWQRWPSGTRQTLLLGKDPTDIPEAGGDPFVIHPTGYFRVAYRDDAWKELVPHFANLSEANKLAILQDTWALVQASTLGVSRWLELAKLVQQDRSPTIGAHIVEVFQQLDHLARGDSARETFRVWARDFLAPAWGHIGWQARPAEEPSTAAYRAALIRTLGRFGDATVLEEAKARAQKFFDDEKTLSGDLRDPVLHLVGRGADAATWERIHSLAKKTPDTEQKHVLYGALIAAQDPELAKRALALSLTGELPAKPANRLVTRVAAEGENPELAWEFARTNLPKLLVLLSANAADEYLPFLFRQFSDEQHAAELEKFTKENFPPSAARPTAIAADEIRFKAEFRSRLLPEIGKLGAKN